MAKGAKDPNEVVNFMQSLDDYVSNWQPAPIKPEVSNPAEFGKAAGRSATNLVGGLGWGAQTVGDMTGLDSLSELGKTLKQFEDTTNQKYFQPGYNGPVLDVQNPDYWFKGGAASDTGNLIGSMVGFFIPQVGAAKALQAVAGVGKLAGAANSAIGAGKMVEGIALADKARKLQQGAELVAGFGAGMLESAGEARSQESQLLQDRAAGKIQVSDEQIQDSAKSVFGWNLPITGVGGALTSVLAKPGGKLLSKEARTALQGVQNQSLVQSASKIVDQVRQKTAVQLFGTGFSEGLQEFEQQAIQENQMPGAVSDGIMGTPYSLNPTEDRVKSAVLGAIGGIGAGVTFRALGSRYAKGPEEQAILDQVEKGIKQTEEQSTKDLQQRTKEEIDRLRIFKEMDQEGFTPQEQLSPEEKIGFYDTAKDSGHMDEDLIKTIDGLDGDAKIKAIDSILADPNIIDNTDIVERMIQKRAERDAVAPEPEVPEQVIPQPDITPPDHQLPPPSQIVPQVMPPVNIPINPKTGPVTPQVIPLPAPQVVPPTVAPAPVAPAPVAPAPVVPQVTPKQQTQTKNVGGAKLEYNNLDIFNRRWDKIPNSEVEKQFTYWWQSPLTPTDIKDNIAKTYVNDQGRLKLSLPVETKRQLLKDNNLPVNEFRLDAYKSKTSYTNDLRQASKIAPDTEKHPDVTAGKLVNFARLEDYDGFAKLLPKASKQAIEKAKPLIRQWDDIATTEGLFSSKEVGMADKANGDIIEKLDTDMREFVEKNTGKPVTVTPGINDLSVSKYKRWERDGRIQKGLNELFTILAKRHYDATGLTTIFGVNPAHPELGKEMFEKRQSGFKPGEGRRTTLGVNTGLNYATHKSYLMMYKGANAFVVTHEFAHAYLRSMDETQQRHWMNFVVEAKSKGYVFPESHLPSQKLPGPYNPMPPYTYFHEIFADHMTMMLVKTDKEIAKFFKGDPVFQSPNLFYNLLTGLRMMKPIVQEAYNHGGKIDPKLKKLLQPDTLKNLEELYNDVRTGNLKVKDEIDRGPLASEPTYLETDEDMDNNKKLGFYSALYNHVNGLNFTSIPAKDLLQNLYNDKTNTSKVSGVKLEEMEDIGLITWLQSQTGKVSRNDILDFIRKGGIQLEEINKGKLKWKVKDHQLQYIYDNEQDARKHYNKIIDRDLAKSLVKVMDHGDQIIYEDKTDSEEDPILLTYNKITEGPDAGKFVSADAIKNNNPNSRKWDKDILLSKLIRMQKETVIDEYQVRIMQTDRTSKYSQYNIPGGTNYREILLRLPNNNGYYKGLHWEEKNVLVHIRTTDRIVNGKKTIFIEEIQSDWHQKGRTEGYVGYPSEDTQKELTRLREQLKGLNEDTEKIIGKYGGKENVYKALRDIKIREYDPENWDRINSDIQKYNHLSTIRENVREDIKWYMDRGVDNAPMKKTSTWAMLAMKRVFNLAAKEGYQQVMWTDALVQIDRWTNNTRGVVDRIQWTKAVDRPGTYLIQGSKDTEEVISKTVDSDQELEELLGKEMANSIINDTKNKGVLEGDSIVVGGKGFEGFYDKILTTEVQKYLKKFDPTVKVEKTAITEEGEKFGAWSVDFTDAIKQGIQNGQPLYMEGNIKPDNSRQNLLDVKQINFTPNSMHFERNRLNAQHLRDAGWTETAQPDGTIQFSRTNPNPLQNRERIVPGIAQTTQQQISPKTMLGKIKQATFKIFSENYKNWVDDQFGFKEAGILNPTIKEDMRKLGIHAAVATRGWTGHAQKLIRYGAKGVDLRDGQGKIDIKPITQIFANLNEDEQKSLDQYLIAKRVIDLANRKHSIEQGLTIQESNDIINNTSQKVKDAASDIVNLNRYLLNVLVDGGLVSEEGYQFMIKQDPNYVPLMKDFSEEDAENIVSGINSKSFVNIGNPIHKIGSSEKSIISPLESTLKHVYQFYSKAEFNQVGQHFAGLGNQPHMAGLINRVGAPSSKKENIFKVWVLGKPQYYETTHSLAQAVGNMNVPQSNILFSLLEKPATWLRIGATATPTFAFRNFFKDQFTAFVFSHHGYIPFYDAIRAFTDISKQNGIYQEYLDSGAAHADIMGIDRNYLQKDLHAIYSKESFKRMVSHPQEIVTNLFHIMQNFSEKVEVSTRLAEYKNAKAGYTGMVSRMTKTNIQPMTGYELANEARDITLDFSRAGVYGRKINRYISFFNANIQGSDKLVREFIAHPGDTSMKMAMISLLSGMLYFANEGDDRYKELPQWEKDLFWIIPGEKSMARLPKPFEAGLLFGTTVERYLDWMRTGNPEAFKGLQKNLGQAFTPGFILTALQPIMEVAMNYDMFRDRTIIPQSEQGKDPQLQFGPYTSEFSKVIGKYMGVSPRSIDHVIEGYTGTLGKEALGLTNKMVEGGNKLPQRTPMEWLPVASAVNVTPYQSPESIQRLFDKNEEYGRIKSLLDKKLIKPSEYPEAKHDAVKAAIREIRDIQKEAKDVLDSKTLTSEQKRVRMDRVKIREMNIAKRALK